MQGEEINREVFLIPPAEANTDKLWRLNKTVCGILDASRTWYLHVREELTQTGVEVSSYDEAIFFWRNGNSLEGIVCSHVDDFFWGGTLTFKEQVIDRVKKRFEISHEDSSSFKHLGSQYKQYPGKILAHQQNYIDNMEFIPVKRKDKNSELNRKEKRLVRGVPGQLNWVASQTQPDKAFDACAACVSLKNATICDILMVHVNKSTRKLNAVNVALHFNDIGI